MQIGYFNLNGQNKKRQERTNGYKGWNEAFQNMDSIRFHSGHRFNIIEQKEWVKGKNKDFISGKTHVRIQVR